MRLTLSFDAKVAQVNGSMSIAEVKHITLTDTYADNTGIGEIVSNATKAVEAMVANIVDTTKKVDIELVSIVPSVEAVKNETVIEEPANTEAVEDDFAANMNAPENVVADEDIPEGMVSPDDIEESPFNNTYYDEVGVTEKVAKEETPKAEEKSAYNYEDMFNKFLGLNYLTRQNLLIKNEAFGPLLPEGHRGDRHKVAFPIAVEEAKKKGVLDAFYAEIDKLASK